MNNILVAGRPDLSGEGTEAASDAVVATYLLPDEICEENFLATEATGISPFDSVNPNGSGVSVGENVGGEVETVPLFEHDVLNEILSEWGKRIQDVLIAMDWSLDCGSRAAQFHGVSLLEIKTRTDDGDLDESVASSVTITYKLVYWDQVGTHGRFINDLNTPEQRRAKVGYMPKVFSKDISELFGSVSTGSSSEQREEATILLNDLPVEVTRAVYMRSHLPEQLGTYLEFIEGLRDVVEPETRFDSQFSNGLNVLMFNAFQVFLFS